MPLYRPYTRLHKLVLALCVTGCLAVAAWPRRPPPRPSSIQDVVGSFGVLVDWMLGRAGYPGADPVSSQAPGPPTPATKHPR